VRTAFFLIFCIPLLISAADAPEARISNRLIDAKLYLPDPQQGYYRGTRFDWSGVISSLRYKGHEYFGQWFERYDPKIHDAIMGPVEEFLTHDAGLGYAEAKPGGSFIRIGVGVVQKPDEPAYERFKTYEIADPGRRKLRKGKDWIEFTHELSSDGGYAYVYRKTIRLAKDKPVMTIEHALRNTGHKAIETAVYDHNFFVIDGQPTGPESVVRLPFEARATRDLKGLAEVRASQVMYLKELEKGQSTFTELEGFGTTARDYDIRLENKKAGAGVRITGDRPIAKLVYWSIRTTFCPEPYINLSIEPGGESVWKISYEFYTLPEQSLEAPGARSLRK
jgi:hypothetical protein